MYLRSAIAALLLAAVSGQLSLCGFKSNVECGRELKQCGDDVTREVTKKLLKLPEMFIKDAAENSRKQADDFFRNPFGAIGNAFKNGFKDFNSGVQATTQVTKILQSSIQPLLDLIKPENVALNPLKAPVKIILQTMIVLRDFTDNTELRNNSQVDKIINVIIPIMQVINDNGITCGANAVGFILQFPLRGVAWVIGRILEYMNDCYSLVKAEMSDECKLEGWLVNFALGSGIWLLQTGLKLFGG